MPPTASRKAELRAVADTMIRNLMVGLASNPIDLYECVAHGPFLFRQTFLRDFKGLPVDGHVADLVFKFFCDQVVRRHPGLAPQDAASQMLDAIEPISPPTEAEIEAAWTHEIASSEAGRLEFYRDGAGIAGQDHKVTIH